MYINKKDVFHLLYAYALSIVSLNRDTLIVECTASPHFKVFFVAPSGTTGQRLTTVCIPDGKLTGRFVFGTPRVSTLCDLKWPIVILYNKSIRISKHVLTHRTQWCFVWAIRAFSQTAQTSGSPQNLWILAALLREK